MRLSHRSVVLLLALAMFLTISRPAEAYIDAGSGSYLLQIVFATLFGAAFAVKSSFANIKAMLTSRRTAKTPAANKKVA